MALMPWPITVNHLYEGTHVWMWIVVIAAGAVLWLERNDKPLLLCAAFYLIFWLPTSGLIPVAAFFAERFLYAPLIAIALLFGWLWKKASMTRLGKPVAGALVLINAAFLAVTLNAMPVWRDDISLWRNAAKITPGSWRVWVNLAESEKIVRGPAYVGDAATLGRIKTDLMTALKCSMPSKYASDAFLELSRVQSRLGERQGAVESARRAASLRKLAE
jgi:hypothetical protein